MVNKRTFIVNSEDDELEVFFTKDNTIRMYITPDGDSNDYARHSCYDIESVEDLDELISELNSHRDALIYFNKEKDNQ